jgi:hypothetical protein
MSEHYTKGTVEASCWCSRCGGMSPHRIDGGRRGPCLVCLGKLAAAMYVVKEPDRQMDMFSEVESS